MHKTVGKITGSGSEPAPALNKRLLLPMQSSVVDGLKMKIMEFETGVVSGRIGDEQRATSLNKITEKIGRLSAEEKEIFANWLRLQETRIFGVMIQKLIGTGFVESVESGYTKTTGNQQPFKWFLENEEGRRIFLHSYGRMFKENSLEWFINLPMNSEWTYHDPAGKRVYLKKTATALEWEIERFAVNLKVSENFRVKDAPSTTKEAILFAMRLCSLLGPMSDFDMELYPGPSKLKADEGHTLANNAYAVKRALYFTYEKEGVPFQY